MKRKIPLADTQGYKFQPSHRPLSRQGNLKHGLGYSKNKKQGKQVFGKNNGKYSNPLKIYIEATKGKNNKPTKKLQGKTRNTKQANLKKSLKNIGKSISSYDKQFRKKIVSKDKYQQFNEPAPLKRNNMNPEQKLIQYSQENSAKKYNNQTAILHQKQLIVLCREMVSYIQKYRNQIEMNSFLEEFHHTLQKLTAGETIGKFIFKIFQSIKSIYERIIDRHKHDGEQLKNKIKRLNELIAANSRAAPDQTHSKLFSCNLLRQYEDYQYFLIETLSNQFGRISKTNLLYRNDPYNKANIHSYIDRKQHLLFLIQTTNDYMIAAYTESPFDSSAIATGRGLIVSLTNRRVFPNKPGQRAINYDPIYTIFGNSDLRIKDSELFSNIGSSSSCYNSRDQRANSLFGEGNIILTKIKEMEVFEVFY